MSRVERRWFSRHTVAACVFGAWLGLGCSTTELSTVPGSGPPSVDAAAGDGDTGPDAGTLVTGGGVTIQVEPSDSAAAVLAGMAAATKSLHVTMYILSNRQAISTLISLHRAGKDVKVVLNKSFPPGDSSSNQSVFDELSTAGVPVVWAPSAYVFTHEKCVIIDGERAFIMSMNLTKTSATSNREFIALDTDPADVAEAETIFDADFSGKSVTTTGKLLVSPRGATKADARSRLVSLMETATRSLDLEGETLSDTGIMDALVAARQRGLPVRVVVDAQASGGTAAQQSAVARLQQSGVSVVAVTIPNIHSKAIVIDRKAAYVGSMNFTANSLDSNREIGVIFDAPTEVEKVAATIDQDFASGSPP